MKINVPRQPLGLIVMTFVVIIAVSLLRFSDAVLPVEPTADIISGASHDIIQSTPLAGLIAGIFRSDYIRYPATVLILIVNALLLTRLMVVYKMTFGRSFLPSVMYAVAAAGVVSPLGSAADFATGHFASMLLVISCAQAVAAFRRSYRFEAIFKSAFALGFIPLLYPPAIFMVLILPITLFLYQRSGRETIVASAGLLLPLLLCSVGWWAAGHPFGYILQTFSDGLAGASGTGISGLIENPVSIVLTGLYAAIVIASTVLLILNYKKYPNRIRKVYLHFALLLLCCLPTYFIPSGNMAANIAFTAIPASVIGAHFFIKINKQAALIVYLILIILTLLP